MLLEGNLNESTKRAKTVAPTSNADSSTFEDSTSPESFSLPENHLDTS